MSDAHRLPDVAASAPAPTLRASDAERERAAEWLRHAAGEGRLGFDELDERVRTALEAPTRGELERLLADVVVPDGSGGVLDRPPPAEGVVVRAGVKGTRWIVSIMGGSDRKGRWRLGQRCTNINVMGGSDIDLNDVELTGRESELRVYSLMGGSTIRVPEDLAVEVSEFALMGGNNVASGGTPGAPGGPVLRLRIISVMGGSDVKRGRRRKRRDKQRHGCCG